MDARASGVFVGRARELDELERVLAAAQTGSGATALLAGEAGIGKTRLASELARRAQDAGFEVLRGRSIDLVGTELPYQPFVEALRGLGDPWQFDRQTPGSQLQVFEETLALLAERAALTPVLLELEDLHWADTSSLDLVVFLAHNVDDQPILLLSTSRADEPESGERVRRLADGVRRSGSALVLELAPLVREELAELLEAHADEPLPAALTDAITTRSEGNPFFAEELLAAAGEGSAELPQGLRDVLLARVHGLGRPTQNLLRLAAAAGRDVEYSLLCTTAALPEPQVRDLLREAVAQGVLVAEPGTSVFRFRHALLAEAIYSTILPGEREELHARLAEELARNDAATPAEIAPHWAAAGRSTEALVASVDAARQAEAVFGLAEAHGHLERALALWPAVPGAAELVALDLAELCARAARLASQVGASTRAVELAPQAIELLAEDPHREAILHVDLGEYLYELGCDDAGFAELERAVEIAPAEPPSPERAFALGSLAGALMIAWRHRESLATAEQALEVARQVGAGEAEVRALTVIGTELAHVGRAAEGVACLRQTLELAEEIGDHWGLDRAYVNFTDTLAMLGRPRESARLAQAGLEAIRGYGIDNPLLVSNRIEALHASGDWDEADRLSAGALRGSTTSFPWALLIARALVESDRGEFDAARAHFEAAGPSLRRDRRPGLYDGWLADLALWEHRWADAESAVERGLADAFWPEAAPIRVELSAKGMRALAELAALSRARRDADALHEHLERAQELRDVAREAASESSSVTPNATGWLALAEAEYFRANADLRPDAWSNAATTWDQLERPPLAGYCRWRQAEALVAVGASRTETGVPLREAHTVASRIGAKPLLRELELLAQRSRLDLPAAEDQSPARRRGLEETLGLTPREAEVLALVARGHTNREIAAELVISIKTASVHVSHILAKLDVPNRREAAAIAHRLDPPSSGPAELRA
jgi:DNA-binding CsgD family transcriptional regulator/tetratricopeptide (TPR) repeat protein